MPLASSRPEAPASSEADIDAYEAFLKAPKPTATARPATTATVSGRNIPQTRYNRAVARPATPQKELTVGQTLSGAYRNILPSTGEMLKGMGEAVIHPVATAKTFGELAKGVASQAAGAIGVRQDPAAKARSERVVRALEDHYKQTYGSVAGFKRAFATDPASILMDASMVLTGGVGTGARALGLAKTAATAAKIGHAIDPIGLAVRAATLPLRGGTVAGKTIPGLAHAVPYVQSAFSGASPTALREAAEVGASRNAGVRQAFKSNLTGKADEAELSKAVTQAINDEHSAASSEFGRSADALRNPQTGALPVLNLSDVPNSVNKAYSYTADITGTRHIVKDQAAHSAVTEAVQKIQNHFGPNASSNAGNWVGIDALKRDINSSIRSRFPVGSVGYKAIDDITKSLVKSIEDVHPQYADLMQGWGGAMEQMKELRNAYGTTGVNYEQALRKMLKQRKTTRGASLLDVISKRDPRLKAMLSGRELQHFLPGGNQGMTRIILNAMASPASFAVNPALTVAHGAASSPRLMGSANFIAGKAYRNMRDPSLLKAAPIIGEHAEEAQNDGQGPAPAATSGGEPFHVAPPNPELGAAATKIKDIESSGGNYSVVGPETNGDRPYGAYQVMGNNIPIWTQEVLGQKMTPEEFLADPEAQDKVAFAKLQQYYDQYGTWEDATSMWHHGHSLAHAIASGAKDVLGTRTEDYAKQVGDFVRASTNRSATGGRIERASGGKVDSIEHLIGKLMASAKSAKRVTDKTTEPLLNMPDEHIVKALDVAQQAI
jgi:hypothetical protein